VKLSTLTASRSEIRSDVGVVSAGHRDSAAAGARLLEEGGNAVDALVAAAFAGFVVEPQMCGVGGQGRLNLYDPADGAFLAVDHGPRAPAAARADMYELDAAAGLDPYDLPIVKGNLNADGPLAPAVPGAVAGLVAVHELKGRLPLAQVLEPAVELAEAGLVVDWAVALATGQRAAVLAGSPGALELFLPDGRPPPIGTRIDLSELAAVLRSIAAEGAAGFYTGWVADAIEREFAELGGILDGADLASYRPKVLRERPSSYRGTAYTAANDQVGIEALNILERFDLAAFDPDGWEVRHLVAEALGHAFADTIRWWDDEETCPSPVRGLASPGFAAERAAGISLERAAPRPIVAGDPWAHEGDRVAAPAAGGPVPFTGTSQMAAVDREGLLACLTTSVSRTFGSGVLVRGTGFFLNDSMANFDARPGRPNSIGPRKMPRYGVPVLVAAEDGRGRFGACGSGGYRITTGVLHPLVAHLDYGTGLQEAADWPRLHCQGHETVLSERIPAAVRAKLAELGHDVVVEDEPPYPMRLARVCAVARDPATGELVGASNPAWSTAAAGV
jgi:gamma-glutamyltranspeptidase/glutathione hydrolase